jgi:chemotaxis methyl-accepting protein methylase/PAS domain-containing protein
MVGGKDIPQASNFPIVGIGASAGGLEALELFFANMPANTGMAFIVIQHLDPTRKGIMVELLQRGTSMPVMQVKDRTRVKPDRIYIIPPNKDLSILHGVLHLLDPMAPRGLRLPIDFFLRSLAADQQEHSIGIILSGMGSDGTLGLRAIKENAGVVFVQDPATAKFNAMPRSAVEAGLADVVAKVEELPEKIVAYLKYAPINTRSDLADDEKSQSALEKVITLLRAQTGHDFSLYKKTTVYRRLERRMGLHQINRLATYVRYLQENPQELELLFRELLIGVTNFFRDPAVWEKLRTDVLPLLMTGQVQNQVLRAWVPGCATGEEAYSLAILFKEALQQVKPSRAINLQIFATDLDQDAIEKAREGFFPDNISADISAERLQNYFVKVEGGYQVVKPIREMIIFARQNLIMDPPFTKLDLISCRNLLIYLTSELQKKLIPLFHYSLNLGGFLVLGSAETVGSFTDRFDALDDKSRIYQRRDILPDFQEGLTKFPALFSSNQAAPPRPERPIVKLQALVDQMLLQKYSPAAVLTNEKGDIIYISGRTGKYLEPAAGKANLNIFAMAREGLGYELESAFQKLQRQRETVTLKGLVVGTNGGTQVIDVTLRSIHEPEALRGTVLIVFNDVLLPPQDKVAAKSRQNPVTTGRVAELERELNQSRHETQTIREEMQTSQEELKSSYEELQSTNEELQSTNEELTTSREELQSMNEELQTVNNELQANVNELSYANNDMKNLLDSTNIATLFLDASLHVRRFTSQATRITQLIPGDVGRPVTDIASALLYPELADDSREVLRTLVSKVKQLPTTEENWFEVRILPYRTQENKIDGVVITFTDISAFKKLESELRATEARLREMLAQK